MLEDTDFPEKSLRILFGDEIADTLLLLTHRDEDSYDEYIDRISKSKLATRVKIADLTHNSDLSRLKTVTEKDLKRAEKYQRSIEKLKESLKQENIDNIFNNDKIDISKNRRLDRGVTNEIP